MRIGFSSRRASVSALTYAEHDSSNIPFLIIACFCSRTDALSVKGIGREFALLGIPSSILVDYLDFVVVMVGHVEVRRNGI